MGELEDAFREQKVLTMPRIQRILGTTSRMTAWRHMKDLGYVKSYSDRGRYYTLEDIPCWDENGIWVHEGARFSREGELLDTVVALVEETEAGRTAAELQGLLGVRVQNAVKTLTDRGRLIRRRIDGRYVYFAPGESGRQIPARRRAASAGVERTLPRCSTTPPEEVARHLSVFLSVLDEKQRRLYYGYESLRIGHGGDVAVARMAGVNHKTVAKGRRQIASGQTGGDRVRAEGGGRPPLKKTK
ncbi:MAG: hypothetical protein ACOC2T_03395 [Planctomycetota bacterium]